MQRTIGKQRLCLRLSQILFTVLHCHLEIYIALLWHAIYRSLHYKMPLRISVGNFKLLTYASALVAVAIRVQCDYSLPWTELLHNRHYHHRHHIVNNR